MFKTGDHAIVTKKITRVDRLNQVEPGERVKILAVYHGENYIIVDVEPCKGGLPLCDICCNEDGPLRLSS